MQFFLMFLVFAPVLISHAEEGDTDLGCPVESFRNGDYCYVIYSSYPTGLEAERSCGSLRPGGILTPIKNRETAVFIQKLRVRKFVMNYWIGLNDRQNEGEWMFSDGTKLESFNNWRPGEPNNKREIQHCAVINMDTNFRWDDRVCNKKHWYICQFEEQQCKTGMVKDASYCYQLSTDFGRFDEAQQKCEAQGGYLINIKSQETQNLVERMIQLDRKWMNMNETDVNEILEEDPEYFPAVWIGTRCDGDMWVFSDGSPLTNFKPWAGGNVPITYKDGCALLQKGVGWFDRKCYSYETAYTCRFDLLPLDEWKQRAPDIPLYNEPESEKLFGDLHDSDRSVGHGELILIIVGTTFLVGVTCALIVGALIIKRKELLRSMLTAVNYRKDMTLLEEGDNV